MYYFSKNCYLQLLFQGEGNSNALSHFVRFLCVSAMVVQFISDELSPFALLWHMLFTPLDIMGRVLKVKC